LHLAVLVVTPDGRRLSLSQQYLLLELLALLGELLILAFDQVDFFAFESDVGQLQSAVFAHAVEVLADGVEVGGHDSCFVQFAGGTHFHEMRFVAQVLFGVVESHSAID
jgi:hypothetical protein